MFSNKGDRWRLPIQWGEIDHNKMEVLKDPRVDEAQAPNDERPSTEAKQDDLLIKRQ
jgi:hypothetical protein